MWDRASGGQSAGTVGSRMSSGSMSGLVVDVRGLAPALRRPVVFSLLDKLVELECQEGLVLIFDHEPAGLGYQIDLRRETRGMFEFHYDQRLDGAWVALVRRLWE